MAEIVLVHGIDQQQKSVDLLESEWLPNLAGGVRVAGSPDIADRIWREAGTPGGIESRMAFYGNLFLTPGQQGDEPGEFTATEAELAEALAVEWLQHAAARASKEKVRAVGSRELAYVNQQMGEEQGVGNVVRSAIGSVAKIHEDQLGKPGGVHIRLCENSRKSDAHDDPTHQNGPGTTIVTSGRLNRPPKTRRFRVFTQVRRETGKE